MVAMWSTLQFTTLVLAILPYYAISSPVISRSLINNERDFWKACFGNRWPSFGGGTGGNVGGGGGGGVNFGGGGGTVGGGVQPPAGDADVDNELSARQTRRMSRNQATPARQVSPNTSRQMVSPTKSARQTAVPKTTRQTGARNSKQISAKQTRTRS